MGLLTDSAKKSFKKNRMYVPSWMSLAQWAALIIIPIVLIIAYVFSPSIGTLEEATVVENVQEEIILVENNQPGEGAYDTEDFGSSTTLVEIFTTDGDAVEIPEQSLLVADKAAKAFWTNNWSGVPISGPTPVIPETFDQAVISDPKVYSQTSNSIVFLFKVDLENDNIIDQTFQVKVVNNSGKWEYSS
jgi:hypothetical protein